MVNNAEVAVQRKQKKNSLPFKICILLFSVFAENSGHDAGLPL